MGDIAAIFKSEETRKAYNALSEVQKIAYQARTNWLLQAHPHQIMPSGEWFSIWLMLAGRGAGKTRTAAEQIWWWAWETPKTRWLVAAPTSFDVRSTCFEGDSGLLSVIPPALIDDYNKALHEITLVNGSMIKGIPASEPNRFRGPQFHGGWCDELAAWEYLQEAWDMMQFGIRLGKKTKLICTTTPKPKELIVKLNDRDGEDVVVTRASTYVNLGNLSENFRKQILQYEGTTLGRQEIHAEIIDPEESGIVKRKWFKLWDADKPFPEFSYVVQSYDTAFTDRTNNDPTACTVWGIFRPSEDKGACVMLLDAWGDHLTYPDLKPRLLDEYDSLYGEPGKKVDLMLIEDKGSGISLIQDLQRAGVMVRAYNPGRADKMQRLHMVANIIAAGRVYIPESMVNEGMPRDWAEPFINQICSFPESTHDDYVDSCTQALRLLRDMNFLNIDPPPPDTDMYIDERKPRRVNPYAV